MEFTRKHTSRVHDSLSLIRQIIEMLVHKRDQRRDGFVQVIQKAMGTKLGEDAEEVQKVLSRSGISWQLAKRAIEYAEKQGAFTIFLGADLGWNTRNEVTGGVVPGLILSKEESKWLDACWCAATSGRLKGHGPG